MWKCCIQMSLFVGHCLEITYYNNSPVGWAIQLCARQTDWNIPHRGLASLRLDSCFERRKTIFDKWTLIMKTGYTLMDISYTHRILSFYSSLYFECKVSSSTSKLKKTPFKLLIQPFLQCLQRHTVMWKHLSISEEQNNLANCSMTFPLSRVSLCPGWRIVQWINPGVFFVLYLMILYIGLSKDSSSRLVVLY